MTLNVVNKQWSPIRGEILRQSKIIHQHTHQSQREKVISKVRMSILCRCSQTKPFLVTYQMTNDAAASIGRMYKTGKGEQLLHMPYVIPLPIGSKNCFLFMCHKSDDMGKSFKK